MLVVGLNHLDVYVVTQGLGREFDQTHGKVDPNAHIRRHENRGFLRETSECLLLTFVKSRGSNHHALALRGAYVGECQCRPGHGEVNHDVKVGGVLGWIRTKRHIEQAHTANGAHVVTNLSVRCVLKSGGKC